jgi:hypothetical protein
MTERLKRLIKFLDSDETFNNPNEKYRNGKIQTFFCRNIVGDSMSNVYHDIEDDVNVDYCYHYDYIEIFGLDEDEEDALREYGYHE